MDDGPHRGLNARRAAARIEVRTTSDIRRNAAAGGSRSTAPPGLAAWGGAGLGGARPCGSANESGSDGRRRRREPDASPHPRCGTHSREGVGPRRTRPGRKAPITGKQAGRAPPWRTPEPRLRDGPAAPPARPLGRPAARGARTAALRGGGQFRTHRAGPETWRPMTRATGSHALALRAARAAAPGLDASRHDPGALTRASQAVDCAPVAAAASGFR